MAYRDIRILAETMRQLGFPRKISLENFRIPNFPLVAEMLFWMVQRYDPTSEISDNIDEEDDRVAFMKSITQLFATKARLKLNPLKLYQANEGAVKELLKVATILNKAMSSSLLEEEDTSTLEFNLTNKLYNLKQARQLASEITENGARLYDQLGKEKGLRDARDKANAFLDSISRNLDSNRENEYIESCIREIITTNKENLIQMEKMVENLKADEKTLEQKIKRKSDELERAEKRLKSIENVRPAFMDEYEQLEQELQRLYMIYVENIRSLDYVEGELDGYTQKEMEKKVESQRKLEEWRNKIQEEELKFLTGEAEIDEAVLDEQAMKAVEEMRETRAGFNKFKPDSGAQPPAAAKAMRPSDKRMPSHQIVEESPDQGEDFDEGEMGDLVDNEEIDDLSDSMADPDDDKDF